ncbi:hypothetical protein NUW58_g134 [Xylaria curta]|uniref:Uncharacterized protein n=1 Tax=Xylaria curta TaxID=42375 RepID=A0ACC1PS59_9PEZI|nr:hypothetical protein NUW58_g134 [Xylaria curta]
MNGERADRLSNGFTDSSSNASANPAPRGTRVRQIPKPGIAVTDDTWCETNRVCLYVQELCSTCQSLQLGVHCFRVQALASSQASIDQNLRSSSISTRLGSLIEIKTRAPACPLCELIFNSVDEHQLQKRQPNGDNEGQQLLQASCFLMWEVDGREGARTSRPSSSSNMVRGVTRRMHIRWSHPKLSDSYIVYVAPESFSATTSDADRVWGKSSLFLGRKVTQYIENQALVKSWLDLCQKTHQGPCRHQNNLSPQDFHNMASHSYFGVIDVLNMQLTQLPYKSDSADGPPRRRFGRVPDIPMYEPYIALSYVWGADSAYTTTTENVMLHRTHGGLENVIQQFPDAIRDAIELARRLGFKYLWIDRLCIVQDSARSWKLNAYNMDLIYGNAELTICAADGDASAGLCAMRPENHNLQQCKGEVMHGLDLMVTRPPETYIRQSAWNERAWTFQERLLSRRCLIFTNGRVYFQCRSTGMSEEIYADRKGAGWSLDLVDAPMRMFRRIDTCAAWVYMRSVELYTERKLTKDQDVLAAFSGVSNILKARMRAPFIHGLPSSHFDLALLWEPTRAPQGDWSWSGWTGPVAYKDSILGGLLDNVSGWMDAHTWIQWWVRDGHGDLRPLWDSKGSKSDRSLDCRWRGYRKSGRRAEKLRSPRPRENERYQPDDAHPTVSDEDDIDFQRRPFSYVRDADRRRGRNRASEEIVESLASNSDNESSQEVRRSRSRSVSPIRDKPESSPYAHIWSRPTPTASNYGDGEHRRNRSPVRIRPPSLTRLAAERRSRGPDDDLPIRSRSRQLRREDRRDSPPPIRSQPQRVQSTRTPYNIDYPKQSSRPARDSNFFDMMFDNRPGEFSITLKDYPYRVFKTWHTNLYVKAATAVSAGSEGMGQSVDIGPGQVRCHIADDAGDWVGSTVLDAQWVASQTNYRHEFIAISEAKDFTQAECNTWTYYIPKERKESEWDLFYVLLIERKDEKWERVGLGKVFKEAFRDSRWKG